MGVFSEIGRRLPEKGFRLFCDVPLTYYNISEYIANYDEILKNSIQFGEVDRSITVNMFQAACLNLREKIENNADYQNIFKGVAVPFICKSKKSVDDLGKDLQEVELPNFQRAFNNKFPEHHFKAVLQSDSKLSGNIKLDDRSRYAEFLNACETSTVIGWYFPQALQEYDIESQRLQMESLPEFTSVCLSGGVDILAAMIGSPQLLISDKNYAPIICLSAYVHNDPRLVLLLKSYGPHMEFWCMTQMLTNKVTQVSEQWSGGLTIYQCL